jgi:hypothetical protein
MVMGMDIAIFTLANLFVYMGILGWALVNTKEKTT